MTSQAGIPAGAAIAINDMLENCARIHPGQEVLIVADIAGLHGGDSVVDEQAISWIASSIRMKGANASVLWINEPDTPHAWRFPPVVKSAMLGCDVLINHLLNLVGEEILEFRAYITEHKIWMVRNFASTAPLLCSAWAQTPHELVSEIRYQSSLAFVPGLPYVLTDENGTHLEGTIMGPGYKPGVPNMPYSSRRAQAGYYLPWPEWVHPPVNVIDTSGEFIFDCMLSWWSRYIGVSPYFENPIKLTVENNRIKSIDGGAEAVALKNFLVSMQERIGDGVWDFNTFHFGVHPQAIVSPEQCPNVLLRRTIEHSHSCNVHAHVGAPPSIPSYPYWMHCTGDIRRPSLRVGDTTVYEKGHLLALDNPVVKAVAAKYPGRPGLEPMPRSF
jgi:hypothetical protein